MKLKNKTVIITGGSDGLGKEIALKLAKEGVNLALVARNNVRLDEVKTECQKLGSGNVNVYSCDIRVTSNLENVIKEIINDFKKIDILINDAGIWQKMSPADQIDLETVEDVIQTNLISQIKITNLILPILRGQKEAAIINIISKSGMVAQEGQSVYTASKFGMRGFAEVLKAELKGSNIRVANVYQSGTNTKMFSKLDEIVPSEKFTNPADLADVVVFMLSRPEKIWLHEVGVEY